jgi:hypothetical protein
MSLNEFQNDKLNVEEILNAKGGAGTATSGRNTACSGSDTDCGGRDCDTGDAPIAEIQ